MSNRSVTIPASKTMVDLSNLVAAHHEGEHQAQGHETMRHVVTEARESAQAIELLSNRTFDVAFLDLRLGSEQGLDLLPEILRLAPRLDVVVITAYATIETAVEAMRRGAFDYLPKP